MRVRIHMRSDKGRAALGLVKRHLQSAGSSRLVDAVALELALLPDDQREAGIDRALADFRRALSGAHLAERGLTGMTIAFESMLRERLDMLASAVDCAQ